MGVFMEYENIKIINMGGIVNICGEWDKNYWDNSQYKYSCKVEYSEKLFYYDFFEYTDKIKWYKRQESIVSVNIHIKKDVVGKNGFPNVFNGKTELGKLFLLAEYDGIKRYLLFLTKDVVKVDMKRDYIWRIKKQYINETNESLINKINVHRKGIIIK
jgi:hypothetical protein